jgi:hypothetical protein
MSMRYSMHDLKSRGLDTKSKNQGALICADFGGVHELLAGKND